MAIKCAQFSFTIDEDGNEGDDTFNNLQISVSQYDDLGNNICSDQYNVSFNDTGFFFPIFTPFP
jgi:hypothetical protein